MNTQAAKPKYRQIADGWYDVLVDGNLIGIVSKQYAMRGVSWTATQVRPDGNKTLSSYHATRRDAVAALLEA